MSAIVTPRSDKAMRKDAAFQIVAKSLAKKSLCGAVLALPVKLASAGKFMPSIKVPGNRLVWQRAFRVVRVVKLGGVFEVCRDRPTRAQMRVWLRGTDGGLAPLKTPLDAIN